MKKNLSVLALLLPILGLAQSFVFCPEIDVAPRSPIGVDKISIVFKDSRTYEKVLKEKCSKDKIYSEFVSSLKATYPDLTINHLDEAGFYEQHEGTILVKIELLKYDATFYPGVYIANTRIKVTITGRNGESLLSDSEFAGDAKQPNILGYKSGKTASNSSINRAFSDFVIAMESALQKNLSQSKKGNMDTKVQKLKELKELLDQGVLTEDEFSSEKKKVLEGDY